MKTEKAINKLKKYGFNVKKEPDEKIQGKHRCFATFDGHKNYISFEDNRGEVGQIYVGLDVSPNEFLRYGVGACCSFKKTITAAIKSIKQA